MYTHALSKPACDSALEVLAANGVEVRIAAGGEFTPTPAVSHAILVHNRGRDSGLADGIVVTPSHNPPDDGEIGRAHVELQSLMRIAYAVFCLKKKKHTTLLASH